MATKTANYIVCYGNLDIGPTNSQIRIDYTRSQIKAYVKRLRLYYNSVIVAKIDYTI